jgi:hypothetical protein
LFLAQDKAVALKPCLLNPGDSVVLKVITAGSPTISANARIAEVGALHQFTAVSKQQPTGWDYWWEILRGLGYGLLIYVGLRWGRGSREKRSA